jgi:hypothetical protein
MNSANVLNTEVLEHLSFVSGKTGTPSHPSHQPVDRLNPGAMKTFSVNGVAPGTTPQQRAKILAAFDRSGLSAAAFARQRSIKYTTFCFWRQQRDKAKPLPRFAEVELPTGPETVEVLVELGSQARSVFARRRKFPCSRRKLSSVSV